MKIAVIGGGISGLSCAYYLNRAGHDPLVFDPAPGGLIGTVAREGCILETGPESWLAAKPWAEQLIRELGLADEITGSDDARRRTYVLRHGQFVRLPEGLQMVVPTKIWPVLESPLFSWKTKLRMGTEIFRNPQATADRSVTDFVTDHFGEEAVAYLAEPLLAGVYGGSPDALSAASVLPKFALNTSSASAALWWEPFAKSAQKPSGEPVFKTMRGGMGTLIDALVSRVNIVRARAESMAPADGGWLLFAEGQWQPFDHVIVACGARNAQRFGRANRPSFERVAGRNHHAAGSAIWTFGFRRSDVPHALDAFGFLVPKTERRAIMACTWLGTKWPGRVPDGKAVFRCFSTDPDVSREAVLTDLNRLMGMSAEPVFELNHRWPDSMPQYSVGHTTRVAEIDARAAAIPGFSLIGNAFHGIGIPDCVRSARNAAAQIASNPR